MSTEFGKKIGSFRTSIWAGFTLGYPFSLLMALLGGASSIIPEMIRGDLEAPYLVIPAAIVACMVIALGIFVFMIVPLLFIYTTVVYENGIRGYSHLGSYKKALWADVASIKPYKVAWLPYLDLLSSNNITLATMPGGCYADIQGFRDAVIAHAGPNHPLSVYLSSEMDNEPFG